MVNTPWGESQTLRERRLQPVRGAAQAEVEKNQRERLYGALVASVAERGYAATTVADLVELSGVSSRSFYDLFGDMQGCVTALATELMAMARSALEDERKAEGMAAEAKRRYDLFVSLVIAQPAAAKLLLSEVFAAGPEALAPVDQVMGQYERAMRERYEQTPERAGMPEPIVAAIVGGVFELARSRLRLGRVEELRRYGEQVAAWALSYRPPPEPLRLGVRHRGAERESLEGGDHTERAIRSFAILCAEKGYQATTVDDIVKLASMSSRTFYANFSGKEDLMEAAIDTTCAQMVAAAMPAFSRHEEWPAGIRAGMGAMLGYLASRPALARLLMVETYVAGDFAIARRNRGVAPLGLLLENNTTEWQLMPHIAYELIAGGAVRLIYREITRNGPQTLPSLAPILTYITLFPFLGPDHACEIANGGGAGRPRGSGRTWVPVVGSGALPLRTPVRKTVSMMLLTLLERTAVGGGDGLTATEIGEEIGESAEKVEPLLQELTGAGVIEIVDSPEAVGDIVLRYRSISAVHRTHIVSKLQTEQMTLEERQAVSIQIRQQIDDDVEAAIREFAFDQRPERYLTRTPMRLDQLGWEEMADLHAYTLHAGFEISARSSARLSRSGEKPIEARSVQLMFEMPTEDTPSDPYRNP